MPYVALAARPLNLRITSILYKTTHNDTENVCLMALYFLVIKKYKAISVRITYKNTIICICVIYELLKTGSIPV